MADYTSKKTRIVGTLVSNVFRANPEYLDGNPYCARIIMSDEQAKQLNAVKVGVLKEAFGDKPKKVTEHFIKKGEDEEYANTLGKYFINLRSKKVVDCFVKTNGIVRKLSEDEAKEFIYAGAEVAVSLNVEYRTRREFIDSNGDKKIVPEHLGTRILGILFVRHGERLGGGDNTVLPSDFDGLESDVGESQTVNAQVDMTDGDLAF